MAEGEQASGAHEPSMEERWEDPKNYRARFEEMATAFHKGEFTRRNEDGSRTTIVSYETSFDPTDRIQRNWLAEFRVRAAGAGLRERFRPWFYHNRYSIRPMRLVSLLTCEIRTLSFS